MEVANRCRGKIYGASCRGRKSGFRLYIANKYHSFYSTKVAAKRALDKIAQSSVNSGSSGDAPRSGLGSTPRSRRGSSNSSGSGPTARPGSGSTPQSGSRAMDRPRCIFKGVRTRFDNTTGTWKFQARPRKPGATRSASKAYLGTWDDPLDAAEKVAEFRGEDVRELKRKKNAEEHPRTQELASLCYAGCSKAGLLEIYPGQRSCDAVRLG